MLCREPATPVRYLEDPAGVSSEPQQSFHFIKNLNLLTRNFISQTEGPGEDDVLADKPLPFCQTEPTEPAERFE